MRYLKLLLVAILLSCNTLVLAQENPGLIATEHLAKAKTEIDSSKSQSPFWLMTKAQRKNYERKQKQKVRNVERTYRAKNKKSSQSAIAKGSSKSRRHADQMYQDLGFAVSADQYQNLDASEKADQLVIANLANSYRLNNETEEAEYWYGRIINYTNEAEHMLRYAQMLQINGKCEDATRWFKAYAKKSKLKIKRNREVIEDCAQLDEIVTHQNVEVFNVEALNTKHLDFSPIPYGDGVVFTSTRGKDNGTINKDNWTKDFFSDLFYSEQNSQGLFFSPVPLQGDINAKFHDGVATFNGGDRVMIFTRNNYKGISNKGLIDLKIFEAVQEDGYWSDAIELPFNSDEFTSCHPTVSRDGQRLYFASNRPGGYGGLDIYVSENQGGSWGEPVNLGPEVNSEGNELFPYMGMDETLYYSSNGWRGLGGLDLFKVTKGSTANESTWGRRENMGRPFNSQNDDFGFYINRAKDLGYLSSNREGGFGGDDIYSWRMEEGSLEESEAVAVTRKLCVRDEAAGLRLAKTAVYIDPIVVDEMEEEITNDLRLTLKPVDDKKDEYVLGIIAPKKKEPKLQSVAASNYYTDGAGLLSYKVLAKNSYRVRVMREGYETQEMIIDGKDWIAQNEFCISLIEERCLTLTGRVKERDTDLMLASTAVKLHNKRTGETTEVLSDNQGQFSICVPCGGDYRISASKDGYDSSYEFASSNTADCSDKKQVEATIKMYKRKVEIVNNSTPIETINPQPVSPMQQPQYVSQYTPQYAPMTTMSCQPCYQQQMITYVPVNPNTINSHFLGDPNAQFNVGQVLTLKNIYYDFDKDNIRGDASIELDHVVNLLRSYPSMEIDLGSHTDARGTTEYNRNLSQRRAEQAVQYIISRGIQPYRVTAKGFGESQLMNRCADGANCIEWEHQQNRRTEVRIRKFNAPNTTISR